MKFVSEIISVKKDKDNKVLREIQQNKTVIDHWKFTKKSQVQVQIGT